MGLSVLDIVNAATRAEAGENKDYREINLDYRDIVVTAHNKYSMDELQEIATGIEMDGLQQPLVLGRVNGEYWLVSGHRRLGGICKWQEGEKYSCNSFVRKQCRKVLCYNLW